MGKTKVFFYVGNPFIFRSGPIGYLYQISQIWPVVFLSEKLDLETEEIVKNKKLFPKLEEIVPVNQFIGSRCFANQRMDLFPENARLYRLAKEVISKYKPDIIICSSDTHSLFELYLMRFAKRKNILKITIQTANVGESVRIAKLVDLSNAYLRFPSFLPFQLRLFLAKCRKYFGHFLYFWLLPLTVGEKPFFGKSSYILRKGNSGMRDSDYQTVFSERDYDVFLKDGVPAAKLYILSHPLKSQARGFFEKTFFQSAKKYKTNRKTITLILSSGEVEFREADHSLISKKEIQRVNKKVIEEVVKIFPKWRIFLKPHPDTSDKLEQEIRGLCRSFSKNLEIPDPSDPMERFIEISDVIVGISPITTALFSAYLQSFRKPILSLDFHRQILGDFYKDFEGIEYIDNEEKFVNILKAIRDNKYQKKYQEKKEEKIEKREFSEITELLKYLLKKKKIKHVNSFCSSPAL